MRPFEIIRNVLISFFVPFDAIAFQSKVHAPCGISEPCAGAGWNSNSLATKEVIYRIRVQVSQKNYALCNPLFLTKIHLALQALGIERMYQFLKASLAFYSYAIKKVELECFHFMTIAKGIFVYLF